MKSAFTMRLIFQTLSVLFSTGIFSHGWVLKTTLPVSTTTSSRPAIRTRTFQEIYGGSRMTKITMSMSMSSDGSDGNNNKDSSSYSSSTPTAGKGKLLVLGGTGFLGSTVCRRALLEGYSVTSLSRRGNPPQTSTTTTSSSSASRAGTLTTTSTRTMTAKSIDYRTGDARKQETIKNILNEGGYVGVIHCIGLLFDDASGLGNLNRFVSGSGSLPDTESTYDSITRLSAFNAIDATIDYIQKTDIDSDVIPKNEFPFVFVSAAEAGWPNMPGGSQIEEFLAPEWLRRYLVAKRTVETKLLNEQSTVRPIIPRPSLVYSLDRPASYLPVGAFFVGNKIGLPFVDRPVTVQSLANAMVLSISKPTVTGILRYTEIDKLSQ